MKIYINTPPPTISGNLHIGHIFSYTHIDIVARIERYLGKEIIFPIGFDCNGIPTENLLRKTDKNIDDFAKDYLDLFKKMNFQMDFENYYKTIDFSSLANEVFKNLRKFGLIYEDEKETWFDIALQSPLSDNEVEERNGIMIGEVSKKPVEKRKTKQFFLKTVEFKEKLLTLSKKIEFYPAKMRIKLEDWIKNLNQDWCISRDREYGIKIEGTNKTFDTWFVSALTHRLYNKQSDFHFQSHEIIRSWCFYSLVMSMHLENNIPFKKVFISGWCIAKDGQKFSKSKGNAIDPNKLIEQYGVNPLRFWACKANWGTDTYFDENVVLNGRRLITKFQNAVRFFEMKGLKIIEEENDKKNYHVNIVPFLKDYNIKGAIELFYSDLFKFCDVDIENCKINEELLPEAFLKLKQLHEIYKIFFQL